MTGKARALLIFTVLAFLVSLLRYVRAAHVSGDVGDFFGGLGVGLLIGFLVLLVAKRTPRA